MYSSTVETRAKHQLAGWAEFFRSRRDPVIADLTYSVMNGTAGFSVPGSPNDPDVAPPDMPLEGVPVLGKLFWLP